MRSYEPFVASGARTDPTVQAAWSALAEPDPAELIEPCATADPRAPTPTASDRPSARAGTSPAPDTSSLSRPATRLNRHRS